MARIDYDRAAATYDEGRAPPLDTLRLWREAIGRHLGAPTPAPVADVGSGTGVWSEALAEWFGTRVVGVEPSERMRGQAVAKRSRSGVSYLAGKAESLPLRDASCAGAWLSTVIHHFTDLAAAARELRRVLQDGSPVLIRSAFPGRHDEITLFRYFPEAGRVAETFPTVEATVDAFGAAGFSFEVIERVGDVIAPSLRAFADGVAAMRHADSTLAPLDDELFARRMAVLEEAAAAEATPTPVTDSIDLLVLR